MTGNIKMNACPHPEDQRVTLGLGIYCNLCKLRVGFVSKQDAEKQITHTLKEMSP